MPLAQGTGRIGHMEGVRKATKYNNHAGRDQHNVLLIRTETKKAGLRNSESGHSFIAISFSQPSNPIHHGLYSRDC